MLNMLAYPLGFVREALRGWLGVADLEKRLAVVEQRLNQLEKDVDRTLQSFGRYQERTRKELVLMKDVVQDYLDDIDELLNKEVNGEPKDRIIALRRRLRNNLTRIENSLAA